MVIIDRKHSDVVLFGAVGNGTVGIITIWVFSGFLFFLLYCSGLLNLLYLSILQEGLCHPRVFGRHCVMEKCGLKDNEGQNCGQGLGEGCSSTRVGWERQWKQMDGKEKQRDLKNLGSMNHCIMFEKYGSHCFEFLWLDGLLEQFSVMGPCESLNI